MTAYILYSVENNVARIVLNRPEKFNSFNREMALQLQSALDKAGNDKSVRAIFITGEGKAFCAGQDLAEAMDPNGPGIRRIVAEHYNPIIRKLRNLEKPVVCGVNGVAAGAGANLAFACDVVIASAGASFIQAFSKIGLVPDSGGTFMLPRLIGMQRASALMMLGDKISAPDALSMGMLYKVCEEGKLIEEGLQIANTLSQMPTRGIWLTKQLLNESMSNSLEEQLRREEELQAAAGETSDYKEGVQSFLEKRKPVFKGE
ncbi:MAG: enoyl-CoA hydratase/isomerase family protein [Bacteroidetes bacterium]|nr:enoyl-CoA hydratase/isomerase family protein [Bacteroidota bacterium]MBK6837170.1 enoyl-CoA hydratase/isomerase family protein [Bacteroidota bacterium]MBK9541180.1 enoyl-CoA hydratase/isomerase family protein [Bacteroidota bacterium]MBL0258943.1 enoyl-CoA hydratase/isomerase family protein [Bacteroidota bacterium]